MGPIFGSSLDEYRALAGSELVEEIAQLAMPLSGCRVLHLTPLPWRGGLVDAASRLISLLREVGLVAEWRTVPVNPRQLTVSRALNQALEGNFVEWTPDMHAAWLGGGNGIIGFSPHDYDFIVVHDADLMGMAEVDSSHQNARGATWIWHCHSDPSRLQPDILDMLAFHARRYHHSIVCSFEQGTANSGQSSITVPPTIDPLHPRNCEQSQQLTEMVLGLHGLDPRGPLVLQVLHNTQPLGTGAHFVDGFLLARERVPELQLLTLVTGDEDGQRALALSKILSHKLVRSNGSLVMPVADGIGSAEINAFQRAALAVVGECDDEQCAVPLLEAMWKRRPVVVGGGSDALLGIQDGQNGCVVRSAEDFVNKIVRLMESPSAAAEIGQRAKEHVRENFLITRLLYTYLTTIRDLGNRKDVEMAGATGADQKIPLSSKCNRSPGFLHSGGACL